MHGLKLTLVFQNPILLLLPLHTSRGQIQILLVKDDNHYSDEYSRVLLQFHKINNVGPIALCNMLLSLCCLSAKVPGPANSLLCREIIPSIITSLALKSFTYLPKSLTISSRCELL